MSNKLTGKSYILPKMEHVVLPPLLYPARTSAEKAWMRQLKEEGKIRSIGPRLYASHFTSNLESVVRSCWSDIVSRLYPEAVLSHRSALEYRPDPDGVIYLTSSTNRRVQYPGLTLEFLRGPKALADDPRFMGFRASSMARAMLENLSATKNSQARVIPLERLEERLESHLHINGEAGLNELREQARELANQLGWDREFKKLNQMIGEILGTRSARGLKSPVARARALGRPFDPACNEKLEALFADLRANPLVAHKDDFKAGGHLKNKAFFEAYFSNYIEGTTFEIEEAEQIIFDGQIPEDRPQDAHDVLGTYQIVSDPNEMRRCPRSADELEEILKSRHGKMMDARPEISPGEYKVKPNRAGDTRFVDPEYIGGTLEKGFQKYKELPTGLVRAIFMMFLIAEVHPFVDGNGRIARIMMNSELQSQGLATIIIPTVYREDYLTALRALSRRARTEPVIKMLGRAQRFSNLEFSPYRKILGIIEHRNWFREPSDAKIIE